MQEYLPPAKNSQQKVEALSCNIQYSRDCLVVQTEVKIKWWNKSLVFEVTFHCGQSRSYVFASFVWFQNKFPKNFHITSKTTFYNNHPHNSFLKKKNLFTIVSNSFQKIETSSPQEPNFTMKKHIFVIFTWFMT